MGIDQFVSYSNAGIGMQPMGMAVDGQQMYRLPVFDIKVEAAKKTAYSKVSQNELALQFYQMGFFAPQQVDQAMAALQMMDFDDKDRVARMIARNGTMQRELAMYQQYALAMTQKYEPQNMERLAASMTGQMAQIPAGGREKAELKQNTGEDARMTKARAQAREASQVDV
jgi:hypothetical protein